MQTLPKPIAHTCNNRRYEPGPLARRFWSKIKIGWADECWLWCDPVDLDGYGRMGVTYWPGKSRFIKAPRIAFMLEYGGIPDGLQVLHRCDTPACVNPRHLFLGTDEDNKRDRYLKGRYFLGERAPKARLTVEAVTDIRIRIARGEASREELAAQYAVTKSAIQNVIHRRAWKHV